MDRFAWFVDAGYLYVAGGNLCLGTRRRSEVAIDFDALTTTLVAEGQTHSPEERFLRTYWYDGARDGTPTAVHSALGARSGVKLRLGRTVDAGANRIVQKGVDSLIVRDLIRLSQNRAITTAYLLGGDEDLRQGMVEAQDMGVRVVLVGIEPFPERNQAASLIREADDLVVLGREVLESAFKRREPARH